MTSLKNLDVYSGQSGYLYLQKRLPKFGYTSCAIAKRRNKLTNEIIEHQPKFVFIDAANSEHQNYIKQNQRRINLTYLNHYINHRKIHYNS